jgi:N-acyl-D-amino-acid deacylase
VPSIQDAAALIENAQKEGVAVHANLYPYSASQTTLNIRLPDWAREGGSEKLVERLRDPATRQRIRREVASLLSTGIAGATAETILFGATPYEGHKNLQGKRIAEIAELMEVGPAEAMLELIDKAEGQTSAIYFGMREEDVRYALSLDWTTVGSDGTAIAPQGVLARSHPHPRWYGTFPRVLGHYVREEKVLTLPAAIRKITSLPAARIGLADRGTVAPGFKADLAVFDPETIRDRSTFENPHQLSEGVVFLTVNGELVLEEGQHTGAAPGRVLRHGREAKSSD